MPESRRKPIIAAAVGLSALLFATAFIVQNRITSSRAGEWVEVKKADLVLGVDVIGQLDAADAEGLGPPQIDDVWDFKISMMAAEGAEVKQGQPVLGFDTNDLRRKLEQEQADADSARKEIEKKQSDLALGRRDQELKLAEAQSRLRKAELKLVAPGEIMQLNERKKIEFDLQTAKKEVTYRTGALASLQRSADSEIRLLQAKLDRASRRVALIEANIAAMTVRAPRSGTVIYLLNRRNEKKKVGDGTWRGERLMQIPDLSRLRATGEIDEIDAGRVFRGQPVTLRLDALPDDEIHGKIVRTGLSVHRSQSKPVLKMMKVDIALNRVDPVRMRPGMRFRGTVETDRLRSVLLVPVDAVQMTSAGPRVLVRGVFSNDERTVQLGRRNSEHFEVVEGLAVGERVMRRSEKETEKS